MDWFNDPNCRNRDLAGHRCVDKNADLWCRPGVGPRPGTMCHYEVICRAEDARQAAAEAVAAWAAEIDQLTTVDQVTS